MSTETAQLLILIPLEVLLCLPLFAVTWFATRKRSLKLPEAGFPHPRKEALLSITVVATVVVALTGYIFLMYLVRGGNLGTPSSYSLSMALIQWGVMGAIFILPVLALVKARHQSFETVGLTKKNMWFSIALGLILGLIFVAIGILFSGTTGKATVDNVVYGFVYFLAVGFGEELLMRGYFQTRCISWLGTGKGLILASLTMAFYHLPQRIFAVGLDPLQAVLSATALVPLSFAFGFLMLRTRNILGPTVMHLIIDWIPSII